LNKYEYILLKLVSGDNMLKVLKNKEFLKMFINISLPVMISSFISFFVNFLDNLMVGTVSNEAVSGVYAANQVTYLVQMSIFGILEGAGIFIQQYNGTKDYKNIKACFRYKIYIIILLLIFIFPLTIFFSGYLITAYSKSDLQYELIYNEATSYLNIVMLSFVPYAVSFVYSSSLREMGNTKDPMVSSVIAIIANSILNAIFIFGFKMGAKGAAIATVISRVFEMGYLITLSIIKKYECSYQAFKTLKIDKELFKAITNKTTFLFINEMGFAAGMMLQSLAFSQRDNVLSSISIVTTITEVFAMFGTGLNVSIGVIVGGELGRDEFTKAKEDENNLLNLGIIVSAMLGLILIILSPFIPLLFTEVNEAQKALATKLIIIYGLDIAFQIIALESYYTLRVGGRTFETFIFDSGSMFLLYIPVSWILAKLTNIDMLYIYLIVRSIDILKAIFGLFLIKQYKWVKNITV